MNLTPRAQQKPRHIPKAERPETLSQAQTWETSKGLYLKAGLCHRCAAQAAWGHQIGFSRLEHQPCQTCAPVVAGLPSARPNGWRSFERGDRPQPASQEAREPRPEHSGVSQYPLTPTGTSDRPTEESSP